MVGVESAQYIACMASGYKLVIEMEIVAQDIDNLPDAVVLFFCLHYVLDLCYVKQKKRELYFFEYVQKVLFELDANKLSARLTSFMNRIMSQAQS